MARRYDFLGDVNPEKETWRIKVRVIRLWKVPIYNKKDQYKCIEMVLLDEKDTTIQAMVKRSLWFRFLSELEEGKGYIMHKFMVAQNCGDYKASKHPFKINFLYSTCLKEVDPTPIKKNLFNFMPFEEILSQNLDGSFLIDIIGMVTFVGEIEVDNSNGKESKRVRIRLLDRKHNIINLTLWDEFASNITTHAPLGVATLSNCMYGSKMWMNGELPEIVEFKRSLDSDEKGSNMVSNFTNSNQTNSTEEVFPMNLSKTLDELRETTEECVCVIVATVLCIETEYNWFYNACPKCRRKVRKEDNKFWCEKDGIVKYATPSYKVQLRVMDETSSASFVVFEKDAARIIGKSASQVRSELIKSGDIESFPDLLNVFVNNKYIFKVKVSEYNLKEEFSTYTVVKMSSNSALTKAFSKNLAVTQDSTTGVGDLNNQVTPTSSKSVRIVDLENVGEAGEEDGDFSTSKVSFKKIKVEKED